MAFRDLIGKFRLGDGLNKAKAISHYTNKFKCIPNGMYCIMIISNIV